MTQPQFSDAYGLWQWKQTIAWIAFHIVHPRLNFHISQQSLIKIYPDQKARRELAFAAIEELLGAIETSRVRPMCQRTPDNGDAFAPPRWLERIKHIIYKNCEGNRRGLRGVLFRRQNVIAQWPPENQSRTGKISSQTGCQNG
jgi:hypothetical protein